MHFDFSALITATTLSDRIKQAVRVPLVLLSLGLILYYTIYLGALVPSGDFEYVWVPDNVMVVETVYQNLPVDGQLMPNDTILEIDGKAATWTIWQPLFAPGKQSHEYTVQRDDDTFTVMSAVAPPNFGVIRRRAVSGLVALFAWSIGSLVILFATPDNRHAWQLGITTIIVAVVIAASEAALYNVPGGWIGSNLLIPFVAVAWIQVALIPRSGSPSLRERYVFGTLYTSAALAGLATCYELLFLTPNRSSFQNITGVSSYDVILGYLAIGLLCHLIILVWRYTHLPPSYLKQQTLIILVFSALAYLPSLLLTLVPGLLFDINLLPWELAILLLALSPIGYAFVIYRRSYLGLDIFVTKTLSILIVSLLLVSGYSFAFHFVQRQGFTGLLGPLSSALLVFLLVPGVPYANKKIRRVIDMVIYGADAHYQENIVHFTSVLSADPRITTLKEVVHEAGAMLQIRQIALMLADNDDTLVVADQLRVNEEIQPILIQEFDHVASESTLKSVYVRNSTHFIFTKHSWIKYIVPLSVGGKILGVLLLGRPVPDGFLNAEQVGFLRQVAGVMAVAFEAIKLFESSREMSRTLIKIRDSERAMLAAQIHDEPLQRISVIVNRLKQLGLGNESVSGYLDELVAHSDDLQRISKQLRDICAGLYPPILQQGPIWAVKDIVYSFREKTNLDIELSITISDELMISESVTRTVYYLLTESMNNVHKHAQAATVWVSIGTEDNRLILTVEDNGKTMPSATLPLSDLIRARHFGIVGMHELASLIQGDLIIKKRDGGGTIVTLSAPIDRQSN